MLRPEYILQVQKSFRVHPVVAILGPRQCGKTTLARLFYEEQQKKHPRIKVTHFDLENPRHTLNLEHPLSSLELLEGLVVIEEIQKIPNLFPVLRVLVDRPKNKNQFLILG